MSKGLPVIVDRIEERDEKRLAVLCFEDGQELTVGLNQLPPGVKEGTALTIAIALDLEETGVRKARFQKLRQRLESG